MLQCQFYVQITIIYDTVFGFGSNIYIDKGGDLCITNRGSYSDWFYPRVISNSEQVFQQCICQKDYQKYFSETCLINRGISLVR